MVMFDLPVRVYYEDTDAGGVVYHSNYLNFFERGRTEYLRALGFEQDQLRDELDILFVVKRVEVDFKIPAKFNQLLNVSVEMRKAAGVRLHFVQEITTSDKKMTFCVGNIEVVCIRSSTLRPTPIPKVILQAIQDAN